MTKTAISESLAELSKKVRQVIKVNKTLANDNQNLRQQLDAAQERIKELEFELSCSKENEFSPQ